MPRSRLGPSLMIGAHANADFEDANVPALIKRCKLRDERFKLISRVGLAVKALERSVANRISGLPASRSVPKFLDNRVILHAATMPHNRRRRNTQEKPASRP